MREGLTSAAPQAERGCHQGDYVEYPMSAIQRMRWVQHLLSPLSPALNVNFDIALSPTADLANLEQAIARLLERHPVLRTIYAETEAGSVQRVGSAIPSVWKVFDVVAPVADDELARLLHEEADRPFDLKRGPVIRVNAFRAGGQPLRLQVVAHHIAMDFASLGLFVTDLVKLQSDAGHADADADADAAPPAYCYGDYARDQQAFFASAVGVQGTAFWADQLSRELPVLALPIDRPYPATPSYSGRRVVRPLAAEASIRVRRLARDAGATPFMVMLACFTDWLASISGQSEVVIGTPLNDRTDARTAALIGDFANTVPLTIDIGGCADLLEKVGVVREVVLAAMEHGRIPLTSMRAGANRNGRQGISPIFQVLFVWNRFELELPSADMMAAAGLAPGTLHGASSGASGSAHDITLMVIDHGKGFELCWTFNADIFLPATMARLCDAFDAFLAAGDREPHAALGRMPHPAWNETEAQFPDKAGMHELIEDQVRRTPNAVALASASQGELSYAEMNERADQLAHYLVQHGAGPDSIVALLLDRSLELPIALLAVLKAGAAYCPIDPEAPVQRVVELAKHARPIIVLSQLHLVQKARATGLPVLLLDQPETDALLFAEADEPLQTSRACFNSRTLAYLLYTSGSTGRPKGVMIEHRALVNRIWWMQRQYQLSPTDVVLQKTPYFFDVSGWEFFWPLMTGAKLVLAAPGEHRNPAYLIDLIVRERVTVAHFVPSMLDAILVEERFSHCGSLRQVFCSGEALHAMSAQNFFRALPSTELHNLYGPTEAAIDVSFWACRPDNPNAVIPIGHPIDNVRLYVLDRNLDPVPVGHAGELCIGGIALARGYFDQPDLTSERFVVGARVAKGERIYKTGDLARYRDDGAIEYLGRIDRQMKLRGMRIEPGEIEAVLLRHDNVARAFVDLFDRSGTPQLTAFFVPERASAALSSALRTFLAQHLPDYMVPAHYVCVDAFPTTPNGKLDREALHALAKASIRTTVYVAPRSPIEQALADIFAAVLGVHEVGIDDGFFELGGDSLSCLRVLGRAKAAGLDFDLGQLSARQTIRKLSRVIRQRSPDSVAATMLAPSSSVVVEPIDGDVEDRYPMTRLQAGMVYHHLFSRQGSTYHDIFQYRLAWDGDTERLKAALDRVAKDHDILRASFELGAIPEPLQLVWREVMIPLEVVDLTPLGQIDQQRALHNWRHNEKRLGFDWSKPPLLRCALHIIAKKSAILSLSFSHAILDGWSVAVLLQDILAELSSHHSAGGSKKLPPFRTFVELEREAIGSIDARMFWDRQAKRITAHAPPYCADSKAIALPRPSEHVVDLPGEWLATATALADRLAVPLKAVLLGVHICVLSILYGRASVATGLIVNGRPEVEEAEQMLGLFVNTVPLFVDCNDRSFETIIQAVAAKELEIYPYRRFPLSDIQEAVGRSEIFDFAFNYMHFRNLDDGPAKDFNLSVEAMHAERNFPVLVNFLRETSPSGLRVQVLCDEARLPVISAKQLADLYKRVAIESVAAPATAVTLADRLAAEPVFGGVLRPLSYAKSNGALQGSALALADAPPLHDLALDYPRPALKSRAARSITFSASALAQRQASALFGLSAITLVPQAMFLLLLSRLSGAKRVIAGITDTLAKDAGGAPAGPFGDARPISILTDGAMPAREAILAVIAAIDSALLEPPRDLDRLAEELGHPRSGGHAPVCQVLIGHVIPGEAARSGQPHAFDLCFDRPDDADDPWACRLSFDPALFHPNSIQGIVDALLVLIDGVLTSPDAPVGRLPLVRAKDGAGSDKAKIHHPNPPGTLYERFRARALQCPQRCAVVDGHRRPSFADLDADVARLAAVLRQRGAKPGIRVAIILPRTVELIVTILAVLRSGATYVPIDPSSPRGRTRLILEDAAATITVCDSVRAGNGDLLDWPGLLLLDDPAVNRALSKIRPEDTGLAADAETDAYVIYTSGSTGKPKGVVVPNANVLNLIDACQPLFKFDENDVWTLYHSSAFDFSVWEIFGALLNGSTIVLVPEDIARAPLRFAELIRRESVSVLNQTPSAFYQLVNACADVPSLGPFPTLRYVIFGGEPLDPSRLVPWVDRYGYDRPALINMYGITETTVHTTYKHLVQQDFESAASLIGWPLPHLSIQLLDENLLAVPRGAKGEICVSGAGLAREYLNLPELTAERFVGDAGADRFYRSGDLARVTANGELEYLGRIDRQVKIRGYRIELGEVEAQIRRALGAVSVTVKVVHHQRGPDRLVAYLVMPRDHALPQNVRAALSDLLPDYMIPSFFVPLDAMPLTINGKLDLAALPDPFERSAGWEFEAPRDQVERDLALIFESVTQVSPVGVHDDFFAIGGDSIRTVQLIAQANKLGLEMDALAVLRLRTIARLAEYLRARPVDDAPVCRPVAFDAVPRFEELLGSDTVDAYPASETQAIMLSQHGLTKGAYHPQHLFEIRDARFDPQEFSDSLIARIAEHPSLRTSFVAGPEGQFIAKIHAVGSPQLLIHDLRPMPGASQDEAVQAYLATDGETGFAMDGPPPLMRFALFRRSDDCWTLAISSHHAIEDGWSFVTLLSSLMQTGPEADSGADPASLTDMGKERVALELETQHNETMGQFWLEMLSGLSAHPLAPVPAARSPKVSGCTASLSWPVVVDLARRFAVTSRSIALFAFMRSLAPLFPDRPIVVDTVTNGRSARMTDAMGAIGMFWSLLPVRFDAGDDTGPIEALQALDKLLSQVEQAALFPVTAVITKELRARLTPAAFNFTHFHHAAAMAPRLNLIHTVDHFHHPIKLAASVHSDLLSLTLDHDVEIFAPELADAALQHLVATIEELAIIARQ